MCAHQRNGALLVNPADALDAVPITFNQAEKGKRVATSWAGARQEQSITFVDDSVGCEERPALGVRSSEDLVRPLVKGILAGDECEESTAVNEDAPHASSRSSVFA